MQEDVPEFAELRVPREFAEQVEQPETIARLENWKRRAHEILTSLREHLHARGALEARQQAEVVYHVAAFDGEEAWVSGSARDVAADILSSYITPNAELLERTLRDFVKPIFQPNPHPHLNVETGRKLSRPAGGPLGHLDYLEGQEWKSYPAVSNVLSWCTTHADARIVERLWHLYIPPIMTLLDDHQAQYKLRGVRLVSQLLEAAPPELLRRTGIDTLILNSLKTCLTFLHNPETPDLIRATVATNVQLIKLTTAPGSTPRFDQLCSLLGDGIIGNIWVYASHEPETLQASVDAIPDIVRALDIGTTRYLKALIPQLTFPLIPAPENGAGIVYKRSSVEALCEVLRVCTPRIHKWRGTIADAILRCWADLAYDTTPTDGSAELKAQLRSAYMLLQSVCQPIAPDLEADIRRVVALDPGLFSPLFEDPALETCA
ncbi:hypothetical protein C8Q76DRAFT_723258 [Earliella scabrosa]|nr:hypothetical protein C8Q76DRAFT_723258 [Earliella scabrosa]